MWFDDDAEKWSRVDDEDTPLWSVEGPESGEVFDVHLREMHVSLLDGEDPDVVIDA